MSKYPNIKIRLTGRAVELDKNFTIMSAMIRAMRHANVRASDIAEFKADMQIGSYNECLRKCEKYVTVIK